METFRKISALICFAVVAISISCDSPDFAPENNASSGAKKKHSSGRIVGDILYSISEYGYNYLYYPSYSKQFIVTVQNLTNSPQIVQLEIASLQNNVWGSTNSFELKSIDNVTAGEAYSLGNYRIVWNPANSQGEYLDSEQTGYLYLTLGLRCPQAGVEGPWGVKLITQGGSSVINADDWVYLIKGDSIYTCQ
jgi:hypothetical protein